MPQPPPLTLAAVRHPAFLYGPDGTIEEANDLAEGLAGRPLTGRTLAAVVGIFDVRSPDGAPLMAADLPASRALAGGEAVDVPLVVTAADGRSLHVLAPAAPILDRGEVAGAFSIWHDVSARERGRAEAETVAEELRTQEEELREQGDELARVVSDLDRQRRLLDRILGAVPYRVSLWDRNERIVWTNERFAADRGKPRAALAGRSWRELGEPLGIVEPLVREAMQSVLAGGTVSREVAVAGTDGREWRACTFMPFGRDSVLVITEEISERKRAEAALAESEKRYRDLFEPMTEGFALHEMILDAAGVPVDYRILAVNPAFEAATGLAADRIVGRRIHELQPGLDPRWIERYGRVAATGEPGRFVEHYASLGRFFDIYAFSPSPGRFATIVRDVTAEREAAEALRLSEARYRMLHESLRDPFVRVAMDGRIVECDTLFCEMLGYSPGEVSALTYPDLTPECWHAFEDRIVRDQIVARGYSDVYEKEYRRKDGTIVPVELRAVLARDAEGRPEAMWAIVRDITGRKEAEAQLERSNRRVTEILASIRDHFYVLDRDWNFTYANRQFTSKIGKEPGDFIGKNLWETFPKYVGTPFEENMRAAMERREVRRFEVDGRYTDEWYQQVAFPSAEGITVLATEVTGQKRAEKALRESEARQAFLLELIDALRPLSAAAEIRAVAGRVLAARLGADRVAYFEVEGGDYVVERDAATSVPSVVGRHPVGSFGPRLLAEYRAGRTAVGNDVEADPDLPPGERAGFRAIGIRAFIGVPLVKGGAFVAGLAVHHAAPRAWTAEEVALVEETAERTWGAVERARAEQALKRYAERLATSNEELQRFAYVASHDLQEPLRSIVSFSQLLDRRYRGELDADADEYIRFIVEGGNRMQRLIQDLLQVSRVETQAKPLEPTDAGEVVASVLRAMETRLAEAGATVEVGDLPAVMADEAQLVQVVANLVGNAIKYRRRRVPPSVRIEGRRVGPMVEFSVRDNGIGIEAEYYDLIFEMFRRLHTHDQYEGTGIGLAVVKKIVDRHGGTIRVESTPGAGSTFSFTLPAA